MKNDENARPECQQLPLVHRVFEILCVLVHVCVYLSLSLSVLCVCMLCVCVCVLINQTPLGSVGSSCQRFISGLEAVISGYQQFISALSAVISGLLAVISGHQRLSLRGVYVCVRARARTDGRTDGRTHTHKHTPSLSAVLMCVCTDTDIDTPVERRNGHTGLDGEEGYRRQADGRRGHVRDYWQAY
jgi:hypothetical protein